MPIFRPCFFLPAHLPVFPSGNPAVYAAGVFQPQRKSKKEKKDKEKRKKHEKRKMKKEKEFRFCRLFLEICSIFLEMW